MSADQGSDATPAPMRRAPQIFRKASSQRLLSPEALNDPAQIVSLRGWLVLAGVYVLVGVAAAWSVFGSIAESVSGRCMLIGSGGIVDIAGEFGGRIEEISVAVGDAVERGHAVAQFVQPELRTMLAGAGQRLEDLTGQRDRLETAMRARRLVRDQAYERQRRAAERRLADLGQDLERRRMLADRGLGTWEAHRRVKLELDQAAQDAESLALDHVDALQELDLALVPMRTQVDAARSDLTALQSRLAASVLLVSPHAGRVIEVKAGPGDVVAPGEPILRLESAAQASGRPEALAYVPAADGKRIRPGMQVQIMPATIRRENYGYLLGTVQAVADYPTSPERMQRTLRNAALVDAIRHDGVAVELQVSLDANAATLSGYKWSSQSAAAMPVVSGTLCSARVTVERSRPISHVIPFLRSWWGT